MVTADVVIRFCTYISSLQKMTDLVACEGSPCSAFTEIERHPSTMLCMLMLHSLCPPEGTLQP